MTSAGEAYSAVRSEAGRAWLAAGAWMLVILLVSTVPMAENPLPDTPLGVDRWGHGAFYAILGYLLARASRRSDLAVPASLVAGVVGSAAFGGSVEGLQAVLSRDPDLGDWIADAAGAIVGVAAWWRIGR
ncbi:MAG: VanZ family protein [Gemmatimonadota bacterium]|nr:VanZ family protein [Gemmatimonadota bacterium]